jgi:hypothetical protein
MFIELSDGVVRLDPDLTGLLAAALMPRFRKAPWKLRTTTQNSCAESACRGA